MLFAEWCRICDLPGVNDAACAHYVLQLHQNGLLKGEYISDRFFHLLMVNFFFFYSYEVAELIQRAVAYLT